MQALHSAGGQWFWRGEIVTIHRPLRHNRKNHQAHEGVFGGEEMKQLRIKTSKLGPVQFTRCLNENIFATLVDTNLPDGIRECGITIMMECMGDDGIRDRRYLQLWASPLAIETLSAALLKFREDPEFIAELAYQLEQPSYVEALIEEEERLK